MLTLRADETHVRGFESAPIRSDDRQRCPEQPWRPAAERLASRAIGGPRRSAAGASARSSCSRRQTRKPKPAKPASISRLIAAGPIEGP